MEEKRRESRKNEDAWKEWYLEEQALARLIQQSKGGVFRKIVNDALYLGTPLFMFQIYRGVYKSDVNGSTVVHGKDRNILCWPSKESAERAAIKELSQLRESKPGRKHHAIIFKCFDNGEGVLMKPISKLHPFGYTVPTTISSTKRKEKESEDKNKRPFKKPRPTFPNL